MFEKFHRGDIYSADLSPGIGSEQSGSRPVLILQNNVGNCLHRLTRAHSPLSCAMDK